MKRFIWILVLSLAANVVLAGLWLKQRSSTRPALAKSSPAPLVSALDSSPAATAVAIQENSVSSATETLTQTGVATWKNIHSADLKEFIRNLRAAGCPEETIQDLILAEVNRRYAARNRELWPERFREQEYWKVEKRDPVENKKNRERYRQEREMQKEKSALLVELLGFDPEKERRKAEAWDEPMDWQERQIAFLPEAKRAAVLKYLEDFDEKQQEASERNQGLWDAESRAEQRKLEAEKLQGLAQFLSPQELREFELRQSQLASQLSHDLRTVSLTRDQYETVFDIRKKYGDGIYNYSDVNETKEGREKVEQNKKDLKSDLMAALGPDKTKEYERSQDYQYQQLTRLAKRSDLPADTASKVYDYKQTAEETVKQLREDKTLAADQRNEALQKIRVETEKTVKEALGEKNYKRYQRDGGWWINNLAPPPPKPKAAP